MFGEPLSLHYTGSTNATETRNDETTAVTHVKLVLDSLTPAVAKSLGKDVHDLCFTKDGRIHDQLSKITVRLREPQQAVIARMALDAPVHVELRNVRVPKIEITKRGEDKGDEVERKSKKVAPTAETLRATLNCLMLPESNDAREFLCRMPGKTFFFEFDDEEKQLDFGPDPDADDEDDADDTQPALAFDRKKAKIPSVATVAAALEEVSVALKPKELAAMTPAQRLETVEWVQEYQAAREKNAPVLPSMPSYIFKPVELTEAGDVLESECQVCHKEKGRAAPKDLNGLPKGVTVCVSCLEAVKRREVGVTKNPDGTLDVTDGRKDGADAGASPAAERAPRRSSKAFTNKPRIVGKKKGRK